MMRTPIECTSCQKPLTGGVDTFSDVDHPMCWDCHSALLFENNEPPITITAAMWASDTERDEYEARWEDSK